jgi:hypothetical protein
MYYLPSKEHNPKGVRAGKTCVTKFIKPCIPVGVNPTDCKMEFSIQYGESTLDILRKVINDTSKYSVFKKAKQLF